jgi:hypothetical protein
MRVRISWRRPFNLHPGDSSVGQAILPAAGFQPALSEHGRILVPGKRRLKGGCSHDWLPHIAGWAQRAPPIGRSWSLHSGFRVSISRRGRSAFTRV